MTMADIAMGVPQSRPPCGTCGHSFVYHYAQGGEEGCAVQTIRETGFGPATNRDVFECKCPRYEPKSYDIEPGPLPPSQVDKPEPPPTPGVGDIQALVMEDIAARREFGIAKYGTPLQAFNGRDGLMDAYQEALDLVVYLRQVIEERKGN